MLVENILLEELEGLDAPSAVGEEETQVVLANSLPGNKRHHQHTAEAAASRQAIGVTPSTACTTTPDIGEVKCRRGREDVLKVFGSRFLESVERRTREVCSERDQESVSWYDDMMFCGKNMALF